MDLIHAHQPLSQKIILLHPPKYHTWTRQDKLIFGALVGSFTPIIPLIQQTKTSCKARTILTNTYAHFSRGHIKQIKDQLKHATKGFQMITKYMQFIKTHVNKLALLGKPMDDKDLIKKILDGLYDEYKFIVDAIERCETLIPFDELHGKLTNKKLSLCTNQFIICHYMFLQTRHMPVLISETTNQVPSSRRGHHPLRHLHSCLTTPLLLLKVITLLVILIWVKIRIIEHKDILLNNVLFIVYCH